MLYTPGPWGGPAGYQTFSAAIPDDKIIYNFHFYQPHKYTHQGTKNNKKKYNYPGLINGKFINKKYLERELSYATQWAKKNKKLLFVGEFSVSSKAPNKEKYLIDLMDLFEKNNLSYAYFSFNGWIGWSYPFEDYTSNNQNKNSSLIVLSKYWSQNNTNVK